MMGTIVDNSKISRLEYSKTLGKCQKKELCSLFLFDDLVDDAVGLCLLGIQIEIPVRIALHLFVRLLGVLGQNHVQALLDLHYLLGGDLDLARLPLSSS